LLVPAGSRVTFTVRYNRNAPPNRRLDYARVSANKQALGVQLEQLRAAGCNKICREKVTGARRPARASQIARCPRPGDIVTMTRIDRLARSTFDLFGIVKQIVDAKAQFR